MVNKVRLLIALALIGFFGYVLLNAFVFSKDDVIIQKDGSQLVRIENYNHVEPEEVTCMALTPECGWCPGEVIDEACYADPETAAKYNN